jgi:salicylate hydroxylase
MPIERVAIIGAGVAGLTAALSFARHGIASDIFEEASELVEVGAGLQISPNASRVLARLDVLASLEAVWAEPERIALVSGTSLKPLAHVPAGRFARERWGAPYGVLHRATLQKALLAAVERNPLCTLHLDAPVRDDVHRALAAMTGKDYPLIVGADGVWSNLRGAIPGAPEPDFSGNIAWRFTIARSDVPTWLAANQVTAFLGPSTHLVAYPLKEMDGFNIVAIASGVTPGETWDAEASEAQRHMLTSQFSRWDRRISDLLKQAPGPTFWPLYQVGAGRWHNGRDKVLIGDAAHAMMPFAAQGAAMAIEDAFVLANRVAGTLTLSEALAAFEGVRRERAAKVRARGLFNRFAYHARGPIRLGRDIVLSLRPPQSLAADLDWLYGFTAE